MRAVVLAVLVGAPAIAMAAPVSQPLAPVVWKNTVKKAPVGAAPLVVSNKLYLNNCLPNGCNVLPGFDDSRSNHSSIASDATTLSAWPHNDVAWNDLVACVKETFLPFHIDVVTTDPGQANHFEVMIAGTAAQLHPELVAGGVAPFLACGATEDNVVSFVFAGQSADLNFLCGAVAQEAAHVWGLDHELERLDPMTYLDLGSKKRFQNTAADCGEDLGASRECYCGGSTQNSYAYLTQIFGAADLPAATLQIATPTDGQWVRPGFPIRAILTSVLGETSATLRIDGAQVAVATPGPFAFNAPTTITGGDHTVSVTGVDGGGRQVSEQVTVHVTAACSATTACGADQSCLGGFCLPGASVDGGLGATCTSNASCITGQCGDANGDQRCTAACDAGDVCPDGFTCLGANGGATGVCWPADSDDGGCATTGDGGAPALLLSGLGFLALLVRRRR